LLRIHQKFEALLPHLLLLFFLPFLPIYLLLLLAGLVSAPASLPTAPVVGK